jgi:predicted DNA-binding transcriptional regulator AlpA
MSEYMRISKAAEMSGYKRQRIYQMISEGLLESRKEHGLKLVKFDDVMNLAREKFKRRGSKATEVGL